MLRVRITAGSRPRLRPARAQIVAAGRPPCPLCGLPLDPEGHVCPRQNGHRLAATEADRRRRNGAHSTARSEAGHSSCSRAGELEITGRLRRTPSNATLYCAIAAGRAAPPACVYKPIAGERPLWDFPDGTLAGREVAAYEVSQAIGWEIVPPTVYRDGPFGPGMVPAVDRRRHATVDLIALAATTATGLRAHGRLRRRGEQRRPQDRPPAADRRTGTCTAATTACASPTSTSCAPSCGSGAAIRSPARRWRRCSGSAR